MPLLPSSLHRHLRCTLWHTIHTLPSSTVHVTPSFSTMSPTIVPPPSSSDPDSDLTLFFPLSPIVSSSSNTFLAAFASLVAFLTSACLAINLTSLLLNSANLHWCSSSSSCWHFSSSSSCLHCSSS